MVPHHVINVSLPLSSRSFVSSHHWYRSDPHTHTLPAGFAQMCTEVEVVPGSPHLCSPHWTLPGQGSCLCQKCNSSPSWWSQNWQQCPHHRSAVLRHRRSAISKIKKLTILSWLSFNMSSQNTLSLVSTLSACVTRAFNALGWENRSLVDFSPWPSWSPFQWENHKGQFLDIHTYIQLTILSVTVYKSTLEQWYIPPFFFKAAVEYGLLPAPETFPTVSTDHELSLTFTHGLVKSSSYIPSIGWAVQIEPPRATGLLSLTDTLPSLVCKIGPQNLTSKALLGAAIIEVGIWNVGCTPESLLRQTKLMY